MRIGGLSKEQVIKGGTFLNYSITWDDAEKVFVSLSDNGTAFSEVKAVLKEHRELELRVTQLATP